MPGGTVETGESGRAHSAAPPFRPYEANTSASGVTTSSSPATAPIAVRARAGSSDSTPQAKGSESVAATIAKRASGRKSASTAPRKVKYAAGIQPTAASSHPAVRRHSARGRW